MLNFYMLKTLDEYKDKEKKMNKLFDNIFSHCYVVHNNVSLTVLANKIDDILRDIHYRKTGYRARIVVQDEYNREVDSFNIDNYDRDCSIYITGSLIKTDICKNAIELAHNILNHKIYSGITPFNYTHYMKLIGKKD